MGTLGFHRSQLSNAKADHTELDTNLMEDLPGSHLRCLSVCALGSRRHERRRSDQYGGINRMSRTAGNLRS